MRVNPLAPALVLKGIGFVGLEVQTLPEGFRVMGYLDGPGDLVIEDVPFDAPRAPYIKPPDPPIVLPTPAVITGITIPRPTEPLPACWFGGWAGDRGPNVPGNMQCSRYPMSDERPTLEQISRWPIPLTVPLLCGYLGSDDGAGADYTDQEIAAVKARPDGRAILIHVDDPAAETRMLEVRQRVIDAGLVAIMGAHAAPGPHYRGQVERYAALGLWGQTRSYHFAWDGHRYHRDPEQTLAFQAEATELRRTIPGCVIDVIFGWDRPGGRLHCPEFAFYAEDIARLTPTPLRLLGQPEPIPPVVTQPPIVVTPTKPKPWWEKFTDAPVTKQKPKRGTLG